MTAKKYPCDVISVCKFCGKEFPRHVKDYRDMARNTYCIDDHRKKYLSMINSRPRKRPKEKGLNSYNRDSYYNIPFNESLLLEKERKEQERKEMMERIYQIDKEYYQALERYYQKGGRPYV